MLKNYFYELLNTAPVQINPDEQYKTIGTLSCGI